MLINQALAEIERDDLLSTVVAPVEERPRECALTWSGNRFQASEFGGRKNSMNGLANAGMGRNTETNERR